MTCSLASSKPLPTMTVCPMPSRYAIQSFCAGDTVPPVWRFISTHRHQAGIKRSGIPATVPEAFNAAPWLALLSPPLGIANIRTSGKVLRNQDTRRTCSRCSDGAAIRKELPIPTVNSRRVHWRKPPAGLRRIQRKFLLCCNGRKSCKPLEVLRVKSCGIG